MTGARGLRVFVLFLLPFVATACAPTWQGKAIQTIRALSKSVKVAAEFVAVRCDSVLRNECIAKKLNPCKALDECHALERAVLRDCTTAQSALFEAASALRVAQQPTIDNLIAEAEQAIGLLRRVLSRYGVKP